MAHDHDALRVHARLRGQGLDGQLRVVEHLLARGHGVDLLLGVGVAVGIGALVVADGGDAPLRQAVGQVRKGIAAADGLVAVVRARSVDEHDAGHRPLRVRGQGDEGLQGRVRALAEGDLDLRHALGHGDLIGKVLLRQAEPEARDVVVRVVGELDAAPAVRAGHLVDDRPLAVDPVGLLARDGHGVAVGQAHVLPGALQIALAHLVAQVLAAQRGAGGVVPGKQRGQKALAHAVIGRGVRLVHVLDGGLKQRAARERAQQQQGQHQATILFFIRRILSPVFLSVFADDRE